MSKTHVYSTTELTEVIFQGIVPEQKFMLSGITGIEMSEFHFSHYSKQGNTRYLFCWKNDADTIHLSGAGILYYFSVNTKTYTLSFGLTSQEKFNSFKVEIGKTASQKAEDRIVSMWNNLMGALATAENEKILERGNKEVRRGINRVYCELTRQGFKLDKPLA